MGLRPTGDFGPWTVYTNKRGGVVWFLKAPPKKLRTRRQIRQWYRFSQAAAAWRSLTQEQRDDWILAARRCRLYLAGYQLWVWWQLKRDLPALRTISRLSRIELPPPGIT